MNSLFTQFNNQGLTYYDSFKDYCAAKGACVEKDGRLVIDTKEFSKIMEEYMESLNTVNEFKDEGKGMNRM